MIKSKFPVAHKIIFVFVMVIVVNIPKQALCWITQTLLSSGAVFYPAIVVDSIDDVHLSYRHDDWPEQES